MTSNLEFFGGFLSGVFIGVASGFLFFAWFATSKLENEAIERGYAEIVVLNGNRKFTWKESTE